MKLGLPETHGPLGGSSWGVRVRAGGQLQDPRPSTGPGTLDRRGHLPPQALGMGAQLDMTHQGLSRGGGMWQEGAGHPRQ